MRRSPPHEQGRGGRDERTESSKRESETDRHYTKSAKYALVNAKFVQKSNSFLKQSKPKPGDKSERGPKMVAPHSATESPPTKRKKGEKPKPLPTSFPGETTGVKKSLSSFKIPKRKSEVAASSPTSAAVKIPALDISEGKGATRDVKDLGTDARDVGAKPEGISSESLLASIPIAKGVAVSNDQAPALLAQLLGDQAAATMQAKQQPPPTTRAPSNKSITVTAPKPVDLEKLLDSSSVSIKPVVAQAAASATSTAAATKEAKAVSSKGKTASKARKAKEPSKPPAPATTQGNLTSLFGTLNPTVIQSLAATIQQTLKVSNQTVWLI